MARNLKRQRAGAAIRAITLASWARATEPESRHYTWPLAEDDSSTVVHGWWGKLSGAASPYSAVEVVTTVPGPEWVTYTGGYSVTSAVYEVNAVAGLAGKVMWIEPAETAGEWRTRFRRKPSIGTCFHVTGCTSLALPGATVTITQGGSTYSTGTTDATGKACIAVPTTGAYIVTVTAPRFTTYTHSYASGATPTLGIGLAVASGYVCCAGCPVPLPTHYTVTNSFGSFTVTNSGGNWVGTQTISITLYDPAVGTGCSSTAPGSLALGYTLICTSTGWTLQYGWIACCCGTGALPSNTNYGGACTLVTTACAVTPHCVDPTTVSFNMPNTFTPNDPCGDSSPAPVSGTHAIS